MTDPLRHLRVGAAAPWPKGTPRNPPTPHWLALKRKLRRHLSARSASFRGLGKVCGVRDTTVRRWFLPRSDPRAANPSAEYVEKIATWLDA